MHVATGNDKKQQLHILPGIFDMVVDEFLDGGNHVDFFVFLVAFRKGCFRLGSPSTKGMVTMQGYNYETQKHEIPLISTSKL